MVLESGTRMAVKPGKKVDGVINGMEDMGGI